jgi:hypothetical protein
VVKETTSASFRQRMDIMLRSILSILPTLNTARKPAIRYALQVSCQAHSPLRNTGTRLPSAWMPSISV